jgi:hypothetical protein
MCCEWGASYVRAEKNSMHRRKKKYGFLLFFLEFRFFIAAKYVRYCDACFLYMKKQTRTEEKTAGTHEKTRIEKKLFTLANRHRCLCECKKTGHFLKTDK